MDRNSNQANVISENRPSSSPLDSSYRFSEDELRVLRECNRESFYLRSLPLSCLFGLGAFYGVNAGFLKRSPRWGPTPKVAIGVVIGYFMGKVSYQEKCAEKIMQLPNSKLAEYLRLKKMRGNAGYESVDTPSVGGAMVPTPFGSDPQYAYSDSGPVGALQLDLDRPTQEGLDDMGRPSLDSIGSLGGYDDEEPIGASPAGTPAQTVTYEELRRRNREEYEQKRSRPYRQAPSSEESPIVSRPRPPPPDASSSGSAIRNQYGDIIER
ncbi:OCIA domain-containing protein 1 [Ischnura elegans]|uniref:OCIA domain-containing protein 1 n=1 Tax=Ischnura elegans TaxID=197161 RepID=UPI001ED87034|nr:OCIA domain-containing protein 1 [Ischnura elegans]